jgi:hypothetical protein
MSTSRASSMISWLPLADSPGLHQAVLREAEGRGCSAVQLSHFICHDADDLLDDPDRARHARELVSTYRKAGLQVWCWTHEVRLPPLSCVQDRRVKFEDPCLWEHLQEKYTRFLTETMPEVDGLVLTFAETDFHIYQDEFVVSDHAPAERVARLANALNRVCRAQGKRLAIRDFVYRRHEVEQMARALELCDDDIAIMTKCVPHDWHPFYPVNPLLGRTGTKEQWMEFDFGHEYEGQHLYPYAEVEANLERLRHAHACGVRTFVVRLDRAVEFNGRSALHTPWGQLELLTLQRFVENPTVPAEEVWAEWERGQFPGARHVVERATRAVQMMLFPHEFWYADHSRLPTWEYATTHLVDGNADRLPVWTSDAVHCERDRLFRLLPRPWLEALLEEAEQARQLAAEASSGLATVEVSPMRAAWQDGLRQLVLWLDLFSLHRRAYFSIEYARRRPAELKVSDIAAALAALEQACGQAAPSLAGAFLEDSAAAHHFPLVLTSLRAANPHPTPQP